MTTRSLLALATVSLLVLATGCGKKKAPVTGAKPAASSADLPGASVPAVGAGDRAYAAGDLVRAESAYSRGIDTEAGAAEPRFLRARVRLDRGDLAGAEADLAAALARDENHWEAQNLVGVLRERQGRRQDALIAFRSAANLAPREAGPRNNLAFLELIDGNAEEAYRMLQSLSREFPRSARIWNNFALAAEKLGKKDEAASAREQASRLEGASR